MISKKTLWNDIWDLRSTVYPMLRDLESRWLALKTFIHNVENRSKDNQNAIVSLQEQIKLLLNNDDRIITQHDQILEATINTCNIVAELKNRINYLETKEKQIENHISDITVALANSKKEVQNLKEQIACAESKKGHDYRFLELDHKEGKPGYEKFYGKFVCNQCSKQIVRKLTEAEVKSLLNLRLL